MDWESELRQGEYVMRCLDIEGYATSRRIGRSSAKRVKPKNQENKEGSDRENAKALLLQNCPSRRGRLELMRGQRKGGWKRKGREEKEKRRRWRVEEEEDCERLLEVPGWGYSGGAGTALPGQYRILGQVSAGM